MAGIAKLAAGMLRNIDLREAGGLGDIFGMAADAEMGDIGQLRRHAGGILGMLGQGPVACLTVDVGMDALCLGVGLFRMTVPARLVAGIVNGPRGDFGKGIAAKMAIATEAFWNESTAKNEEENQADCEYGGHAEKMADVLQFDHSAYKSSRKCRTSVRIPPGRTGG